VKFGFIAHPATMALQRHVKMVDLTDRLVKAGDGCDRDLWRYRNQSTLRRLRHVTSATGATCNGVLRFFPYTAEEIVKKMRVSNIA